MGLHVPAGKRDGQPPTCKAQPAGRKIATSGLQRSDGFVAKKTGFWLVHSGLKRNQQKQQPQSRQVAILQWFDVAVEISHDCLLMAFFLAVWAIQQMQAPDGSLNLTWDAGVRSFTPIRLSLAVLP